MSATLPLVPIADFCTSVTSGGTPSRKVASFWDGGTIPWIKTGELNDWKVSRVSEYITEAGLKGSSAKIFDRGTILMAMYGDGRTITTLGIVDTPSATNQACCAIIVDHEKCNNLYMFYALKYHRHELLNFVVAGAQRNLSGAIIKNFPITYHPLSIQRRIADILSAYDALIENNTRRIAILDDMARRLFEEWFIQRRVPDSIAQPEDWTEATIGDAFTLQRGFDLPTSERSDGPYPVVAASGVHGFHRDYKVKGPGVTTGRSGTIGQFQFIENNFWPLNTSLWIKEFKHGGPIFAYYLLSSLDLTGSNTGAAVPSLNRNIVHALPTSLPPLALVSVFEQIVGEKRRMIGSLTDANTNLRTTRDLLLPKLISGEIEVSAAEEELEAAAA